MEGRGYLRGVREGAHSLRPAYGCSQQSPMNPTRDNVNEDHRQSTGSTKPISEPYQWATFLPFPTSHHTCLSSSLGGAKVVGWRRQQKNSGDKQETLVKSHHPAPGLPGLRLP